MSYLYVLLGLLAFMAGKRLIDVRRLTKAYVRLREEKRKEADTRQPAT